MRNLQVFKNAEFGEVRVIEKKGEPWFVGKDVAAILGYVEPRSAVSKKVDEEDRGVAKMETPSGIQEMTIINESGLYSLILSSKLPQAKSFKHWVTNDVLPAIRKNGAYELSKSELSPQLQLLINMEMEQKRQAQELQEVKAGVQGMRDIITLNPNSWRENTKHLIVKIAQTMGGNAYIKDVHTEAYKLLNQRMGVDLGIRLTNLRRRMADEGICKSKRDKVTKIDVIASDKKLIEGFVAIIKEMAIKYGVSEVA